MCVMESLKINPELYMKTLNKLKQQICHISQEKCLILLQHDNARPHNSAVVWRYRISDVKLFYTLPTAKIWHSMTSGLQLSRNILKELISHVMKQCHLLQENDFKNSLKNSTLTGSKSLFSAGSIVSNKRETMWKIEVGLWKQCTHHELYFVFRFILMP